MSWLPSVLGAVGLLFSAASLYFFDIVRAHRSLLAVVRGGKKPQLLARPDLHTLRARSVTALSQAFWLIRQGDSIGAERALADVDRETLSAWEQRILDATRALCCLENRDHVRAAKLAPLALPTRNPAVDLTLARVLVKAAWDDSARLAAVGRAFGEAGPHLEPCRSLAALRASDLLTGEISPDALPEVLHDAATEAHEVGEGRFGDRLIKLAERRGAYR